MVVSGETVDVDLEVDAFTLTTILDALCNVLELSKVSSELLSPFKVAITVNKKQPI